MVLTDDLSPPLELLAQMGQRHCYSPHVPVASPYPPSALLPAHRPFGLYRLVWEPGHRDWSLDHACTRDGQRCSLQDTAGVGATLAMW